jgi:hypothetical protein
MKNKLIVAILTVLLAVTVGCSTTSPQVQKSSETVQVAGIETNNSLAGSTIDQISEGGAADVYEIDEPFINPATGDVVVNPNTGVVERTVKRRARTQLRTDVAKLGEVEELDFGMSGFDEGGKLEGITLKTKGDSGGYSRNSDIPLARSEGLARTLAAEYAGRGDLVKARADGVVSIVTATGEEIVGRIVAPYGKLAGGVIEAVVQREDTGTVEKVYIDPPKQSTEEEEQD